MYDIQVREDGCPLIENGDFVPASYEQFVDQKIYNALMHMSADVVTGMHSDKRGQVEARIMDYLNAFFIGDLDIDPAHITIQVTPFPGNDTVSFSLSYKGTSPTGEERAYQSRLNFSLSAGALLHADFEPAWLSSSPLYNEKEILYPIHIRTITGRVEIPLEPIAIDGPVESGPAVYGSPIYLLMKKHIASIDTVTEEPFEIELYATRSKYQLSAYIANYTRQEMVICGYSFTDISSAPKVYTITEYGEPVVVVDKGSTGIIRGTVRLKQAVQMTHTFTVEQEMVVSPLFPLRRRRGKYYAIFPKTIHRGDYYIMYKGLSEVL